MSRKFLSFLLVLLMNQSVKATKLFDRQEAQPEPVFIKRSGLKGGAKPRLKHVQDKHFELDDGETVSFDERDLDVVDDTTLFAPDATYAKNGEELPHLPEPAVYKCKKNKRITVTKDHEGNLLWATKRMESGQAIDVLPVDSATVAVVSTDDIDEEELNRHFRYGEAEIPPGYDRQLYMNQSFIHNSENNLYDDNNSTESLVDRQLQQQYKVVQVAIAFESTYCADFDNDFERARDAVLTTVYQASQMYQQFGIKLVLSRLEGYCGFDGDPYRRMVQNAHAVCGDDTDRTLLDRFRKYWVRKRGGVTRDTAHLFHGKAFETSIVGCAYLYQLCSKDYAYGVDYITYTPYPTYWAILLAHEVGHNSGATHECETCETVMKPAICATCTRFSSTSRTQISGLVNGASCISSTAANRCHMDLECNDGDECTIDRCNGGVCSNRNDDNKPGCAPTCPNQRCHRNKPCCAGCTCPRRKGKKFCQC